jgi:hypothetical protein
VEYGVYSLGYMFFFLEKLKITFESFKKIRKTLDIGNDAFYKCQISTGNTIYFSCAKMSKVWI